MTPDFSQPSKPAVILRGPLVGFPDNAPFNCPALALLLEFDEAVKAFNREDVDRRAEGFVPSRKILDAASRKIDSARTKVTSAVPCSYEGATFLLALAFSEAHTEANWSHHDAEYRFDVLFRLAMRRFGDALKDFPATVRFLGFNLCDDEDNNAATSIVHAALLPGSDRGDHTRR